MNKDLPLKVRHIFSNLDPIIWKGIWLKTLNSLLSSKDMPHIWEHIINQATEHKKKYPLIGESQFIKWELKAFVAQTVNLVNKNYNKELFIEEFEKFFLVKGYKIHKDMIIKIYESIYN
tara:strand:+ start:107 stop:463 length:357 start_codon:yes stop_codon:yes gene_type:complete